MSNLRRKWPDEETRCSVCDVLIGQEEQAWESGLFTPELDGEDGKVIMAKVGYSSFCSQDHWAEWVIEKLEALGHIGPVFLGPIEQGIASGKYRLPRLRGVE